jgi:hypothetical protein
MLDMAALATRTAPTAAVASLSPHDHDFGGQNGATDIVGSTNDLGDFLG